MVILFGALPTMISQRISGVVVLSLGLVLLLVGLNASDSFADQASKTFTGKWTDNTAWYVYGGLAGTILGGVLLVFGGRSARLA